MSKRESTTSIDRLHELFRVDKGRLIRLVKTSSRAKVGDIAGRLKPDLYREVRVDCVAILEHRIVWAMANGRWPVDEIDHINGVKDDNRIENLREASSAQNSQNITKARSDNKTGLLGVSYYKNHKTKPYKADCRINGVTVYLGRFNTPEKAHEAYISWKRKNHEFCTI